MKPNKNIEYSTLQDFPPCYTRVNAGFPSPADDYIEQKLDLNERLVKHPAATYFVRVTGDSMMDAGIYPGDILVVDRSIEPADRKIVIAAIDGEMTVKRIGINKGKFYLLPENPLFNPMEIIDTMQFEIWGVVTHAIHTF